MKERERHFEGNWENVAKGCTCNPLSSPPQLLVRDQCPESVLWAGSSVEDVPGMARVLLRLLPPRDTEKAVCRTATGSSTKNKREWETDPRSSASLSCVHSLLNSYRIPAARTVLGTGKTGKTAASWPFWTFT